MCLGMAACGGESRDEIYAEGQKAGYKEGYEDGLDSGYDNGYDDGYYEGKEQGYWDAGGTFKKAIHAACDKDLIDPGAHDWLMDNMYEFR